MDKETYEGIERGRINRGTDTIAAPPRQITIPNALEDQAGIITELDKTLGELYHKLLPVLGPIRDKTGDALAGHAVSPRDADPQTMSVLERIQQHSRMLRAYSMGISDIINRTQL